MKEVVWKHEPDYVSNISDLRLIVEEDRKVLNANDKQILDKLSELIYSHNTILYILSNVDYEIQKEKQRRVKRRRNLFAVVDFTFSFIIVAFTIYLIKVLRG